MKPSEYKLPYTILQDMPYVCEESLGDGHLPKTGVLHPGRVVWLRRAPGQQERSMRGFADGIGLVELETHLLYRV